MATIFISHRRDDSEGFAGRLRDRLVEQLGESAVSHDLERMPNSENVRKLIDDSVRQCRVMLVIIDKKWLDIKDSSGQRRLDREDDLVRLEISAGLKYGLNVIPVLLRGTPMPRVSELPESIQELVTRNPVLIGSNSFNPDFKKLIEVIGPLAKEQSSGRRTTLILAGGIGIALAVTAAAIWLTTQ